MICQDVLNSVPLRCWDFVSMFLLGVNGNSGILQVSGYYFYCDRFVLFHCPCVVNSQYSQRFSVKVSQQWFDLVSFYDKDCGGVLCSAGSDKGSGDMAQHRKVGLGSIWSEFGGSRLYGSHFWCV